MNRLTPKAGFALLCLAVGLVVFSLSFTMLSQAPGEDDTTPPPGNVGDDPAEGTNPTPGGPDDGETGPVGQVNELIDIINADSRESLELLGAYIEEGGNPNLQDEDGLTGLHWAISNSEISPIVHGQVTLLLGAGADPNRVDEDGKAPLHYAAEFGGSDAIVSVLIAKGGNVEISDNSGTTPLQTALYWGNTGAVAALEKAMASRPANYKVLKTWGLVGKWFAEALKNAKSPKELKEAVHQWTEKLHDEGILTEEEADQVYENVSDRVPESNEEEEGECDTCGNDNAGAAGFRALGNRTPGEIRAAARTACNTLSSCYRFANINRNRGTRSCNQMGTTSWFCTAAGIVGAISRVGQGGGIACHAAYYGARVWCRNDVQIEHYQATNNCCADYRRERNYWGWTHAPCAAHYNC